nr:hypothetical protein [Tanacetum cinerariifolium]
MSTESVGNKPDSKAAGMDESSPRKVQEKMSAKSGGTKSDSKGVGMVESLHMKPQKKMSIKSGGTNSVSKAASMVESSQAKPHLFLYELEVDFTGTIVVNIGNVWDGNVVTGRYLSTDFVVSDSRGNMIHCTAKASIAHNFLRLKEGGIYWIKNFAVLPNKDETGFSNMIRSCLSLMGKQQCGRVSLRVTLWGGLDDALIERKTKHVGMRAIVLTAVSLKIYNNKLYFSTSSSAIIYDNDDIPCLRELKTAERYMLEVVIADDTAHTVIMMFNDIATEFLKCSAESLLGEGEDEDDESSLPTTIRNLIGTTHVLEIKSHTYYNDML